jgi:amino acid transporter
MNIKETIRFSLITFGVIIYFNLLGLPVTLGSSAVLVFAIIVGLFSIAFLRDKPERERTVPNALFSGLLIGILNGVGLALLTYLFANLQADGIRVNVLYRRTNWGRSDTVFIERCWGWGEIRTCVNDSSLGNIGLTHDLLPCVSITSVGRSSNRRI